MDTPTLEALIFVVWNLKQTGAFGISYIIAHVLHFDHELRDHSSWSDTLELLWVSLL